MTTNNEQPSPEQTSNGEIPEESKKKIVPEGNYFVAQCEKCGFKGSSGEWLGGGQIAATGDYSDCYCPICGQVDAQEAEDDLYIDQREMLITKITQLNNSFSEATWDLYEKNNTIDHLQKSIIQRDHEWKRIYDQLQEKEKEVAEYRKALEEIRSAERNNEIGKSGKATLSLLIVQNILAKYPKKK